MARHYCMAENAVAVLSNMPYGKSYVCYGHLGERLGLGKDCEEVESIWEKTLIGRIHPDDLAEKIAWEMRFLAFQKQQRAEHRADYYLQHCLRLMDAQGGMHFIRHRIFYLDFDAAGHVRLALCLYTAAGQDGGATGIVHSIDATLVNISVTPLKGLLSNREREILLLISKGKASKQIADALEISINTVNNHRQNILRKLHCQNTVEAIVVAEKLGIASL